MWKATAGIVVPQQNDADDDDWETDPDFVNDVTEEEQRWGAKTIEGSGRTAGAIDMNQLRMETEKADADQKKKELDIKNPGHGYGGKFGVEKDRMDKSAFGHDYIAKVEKHGSQTDYATGFGGKFGVQTDRVDKSAAGWDHKEQVVKHSSQMDYATGFGGKFGVQNDRVDKSAVGWDHIEKVEKHESQKDYSKGFGGKFGVQEDRKDKSAVGWDYVEAPQKHESQLDHKVGFGGKFGVQNDRMDKSAVSFQENPEKTGTNYTKVKPDIGSAKPSNLRAKFENLAKAKEEEDQRRTAEQKRLREEKDKIDREQALNSQQQSEVAKEAIEKPQRRNQIDTGRSGGIGNAISAFNQAQTTTETAPPVPRKEPIKLPKQPIEEPKPVQEKSIPVSKQPDLIPSQPEPEPEPEPELETETVAAVPPPEAFSSPAPVEQIHPSNGAQVTTVEQTHVQEQIYSNMGEQIYSNVNYEEKNNAASQQPVENKSAQAETANVADGEQMTFVSTLVGNEETDLSEYIEDTGIKANALYDYQATADDEISFDPNDIITHIEQIDEGWWRGLCKNRYGLFPANYVQLQLQEN